MQWYGSVICTHVNTELFTWSSICFSSSSEPKKKREWNPPWWEGKNPPSSTSTEINEFDSTPIWVFQRWKRIWTLILTWEPGGEKFPFFPQGPDLIFWQLWELKAWKMVRSLGPHQIVTNCACEVCPEVSEDDLSPWRKQCLAQGCWFDDMEEEKEWSFWNVQIWRGGVVWNGRIVFPVPLHLSCSGESISYATKG